VVQSDISTSRDDKQGVLFGDFDGSGETDVVVSTRPQSGADTTLHVALGDGEGAFGPEATQTLAGTAAGLVFAGDLNNDQRDDIATYQGGALVTYIAGMTASFTVAGSRSLPQPLRPPTGAVGGDFDADGNEDVALTGYSCLVTLLGEGSGRLADSPCTTDGSATSPLHPQLATGDLDGDGLPDLVSGDIWDGSGTSWFEVYLADGVGGLDHWDRFACAKEAFACEFPVVGDLDSDQRQDVVLGGSTQKVFAFHNEGRPKAATDAPDGTDFGAWLVGERTDPLGFVVFNDGERPFDVTSAAITGTDAADFRIVDTDCPGLPLRGRELCVYLVDFRAAAVGSRSAVLTVRHTAPGSALSLMLRGEGVRDEVRVPPHVTPPPAGAVPRRLTAKQLLTALRVPRVIKVRVRAGRVAVGRLANPPVEGASLTMTTTRKAGRAHAAATVRIAGGRVVIPAGRQRAVVLKLTRKGRKLLRRVRAVRATLIVNARDAAHQVVRAKARVWLRTRR
jgi:hypothetical protein